MRVKLLYFGVLKDLFGREGETREVADGANVAALCDQLRGLTSNRIEVWPSLAVAVNREYASVDRVLRDGDEVALLPPVSGGSYGATVLRARRKARFARR
jgi:molybdopterin converting factor subunit 1